jgi:hypothetical protein
MALNRLGSIGWIDAEETMAILNTGTGVKDAHLWKRSTS